MKKKIRDLTLEEAEKICLKHKSDECIHCPLYLTYFLCVKDFLCDETEVEVDEDEK